MVQELLLSSVSRKGEKPDRFMVGDMKQSIYKFRLARPEIFMEKYRSYRKRKNINKSDCERRSVFHGRLSGVGRGYLGED